MNRNKTRPIGLGIIINSIRSNAVSLLMQLEEYDFLEVTEQQLNRLNQIEKDLHELVIEITENYK